MVKNAGDPAAFDQVAAGYDESFTSTKLGIMLRKRVWQHLDEQFRSDHRLLDLACGTGEDALYLAQKGIHVTALDGSSEMVRLATIKANSTQHSGEILIRQSSLENVIEQPLTATGPRTWSSDAALRFDGHFDGVISNFGGLNAIDRWHELAGALALLIRTGGKVVLVPMGMVCPWEIGWYLVHGKLKTAFRRFGRRPLASLGDSAVPVYYPSSNRLKQAFRPWFTPVRTESLGLLLPPSYLSSSVARWPRLSDLLNAIENKIGNISLGWGDHYILILERNQTSLER